jgi:NADPH-dependent glutamate synthase beta subunit-like oxidoreductase
VLATETIIIAAGRFPEIILVKSIPEADPQIDPDERGQTTDAPLKWEGIGPYKKPAYGGEIGFLAKGDALSDFSAAIKAIGAGRRIAASIHQMMYGITPVLSDSVITPQSVVQNVDHVESVVRVERKIMPLSTEMGLEKTGEIEKGFTSKMAKAEADRCLQCGLICYKQSGDPGQKTDNAIGF